MSNHKIPRILILTIYACHSMTDSHRNAYNPVRPAGSASHTFNQWRTNMSAIETWGEMVRVEHAQSDRRRGVRPTDTWNQFAASVQGRPPPHRRPDG